MIYDFPDSPSPIGQGDIFFGVPITDLLTEHLPVIGEGGTAARILTWEEFSSAGKSVNAVITVRPTIAIVGTQECDAIRAPNITLFEVRPFRDVERKSKDTGKPAKWVPIITQHARVNQKWFYLPADERIGFTEKMGADFLTPISIPRLALERLINFRKGRLNEVAKQHFRERLAEFFRRYAYDEWYSLTREELVEYRKNYPDAEPFPWQLKEDADRSEPPDLAKGILPQQLPNESPAEEPNQKGGLDYLTDATAAMVELGNVLEGINKETDKFNNRMHKHNEDREKLLEDSSLEAPEKLNNVYRRIAGDMHVLSKNIEDANLRLEKNILPDLTANTTGYIEWVGSTGQGQLEDVTVFRKQIEALRQVALDAVHTHRTLRDIARDLSGKNISLAFNHATHTQATAYDKLVSNIEEVESFCLKTLFLIDKWFTRGPAPEDKPE